MPLITKQNQLLEICDLINEHKITAIDTEFIRETTYLPILCLIQINVAGNCHIIDTLANLDLEPFFEILNNPQIIKILHSSRQDVEILLQNFPGKIAPQSLFDTQIMAALCGLGLTISYGNLAKNLLDQDIDKGCQRSDWQTRPLQKAQIEYAKIDVLHLPAIYQILKTQLTEEQKSAWAIEEMESNIKKAINDVNLHKNFSFVNKSFTYQQNVDLLVEWRDETAKQNNVPRSFVIRDEILDKIAHQDPQNTEQLEKCGFKTRISHSNIKPEIIELLKNKTETPTLQSANKRPSIAFKLNETQKEIYQKSKIILQEQATKYRVSPELIINQTNLQHLIVGHKSIAETLPSWRYLVFGEELEKLIT